MVVSGGCVVYTNRAKVGIFLSDERPVIFIVLRRKVKHK
jgi:hypothetical protein